MRPFVLALLLFAPCIALACNTATPASHPAPALQGTVADPTGAIVPGAEVDLVDPSGAVTGTYHSKDDGSFQIIAPHSGSFTLVISEPGFETVRTPVTVSAPAPGGGASAAAGLPVPLHIILPIARFATNVQVNGDSSSDLTAGDANSDSSVMSSTDLKALPIFDNDYATAMSAFLDSSVSDTGGTGLMVDGVEANRATVSASAVQEIRINQDPYSAQYYYPGRGQMEIITKSAADHYHGQFNFLYRNSGLNAQNALAPIKPFEQRQTYEGNVTGPIPHANRSSFLVSFNRVLFDQDSVINAITEAPTAANPTGSFEANVPTPSRDTEFSVRAAHQFSDKNSAYVQYSYEQWTAQNQGVGGQTLAAAGYNNEFHEDDVVAHMDSVLSATTLNQISLVGEHDFNRNRNVNEAPNVNVSGDFVSGSAQNDSFSSEYNFRLYDMVTWTHGRHLVKFGVGTPHIDRRAYDDNTNALGTYTFGPTVAPDGTVLQTALQNFTNHLPSEFTENTGDTHFIYHQQEVGGFLQDQYKITDRFSVTPGLRYDWQNFLANRRLGFSPRVSFAWVLNEPTKTIVRGGGGIYYDRFGSGPLLDLARYSTARRRALVLSFDPAQLSQQYPSGCVPITNCTTLGAQPPSLAELEPNAKLPYQIQYGLSVERQLGEKATGVISVYSARGVDSFRSVDINAPTPESNYTERPNPAYARIRQMQPAALWEGSGLDFSYRGRFNKYFTGFGRYTWSHFESNTGGINWFPQNQYAPSDEWSNAGSDRRNRLGMYAMFHPESVFNLSAGVFANSGSPWTVLTGTDPYGDGLFNARPDGVGRNTENYPNYVDMDLRWGHDFNLTGSKDEEAPKLGFSAAAFDLLNHPNVTGIDQVESTLLFGQATSYAAPRRIQLGMRFEF